MSDEPDPRAVLRSSALVRYADSGRIKRVGVSSATFLEIYRGGAPWEIGRPQPIVIELERAGQIRGRVLDVGCGTGENALFLAAQGYRVCAIDFVGAVIDQARAAMTRRGLDVELHELDAMQLAGLGQTFDTVLDLATFHTLSDEQRPAYVAALAAVTPVGAVLHLVCFSDRETRPGGPVRVSQDEIRRVFADGWRIESIREAVYLAHLFADGVRAWAAEIHRS